MRIPGQTLSRNLVEGNVYQNVYIGSDPLDIVKSEESLRRHQVHVGNTVKYEGCDYSIKIEILWQTALVTQELHGYKYTVHLYRYEYLLGHIRFLQGKFNEWLVAGLIRPDLFQKNNMIIVGLMLLEQDLVAYIKRNKVKPEDVYYTLEYFND